MDGDLDDGTISLRMRRATDLPAIMAASEDPATQMWLDDKPLTEGDAAASLRRTAEAWASRERAPLVIADTTTAPLGLINLRLISMSTATVAYSVFPAARGQGIAPRAVKILARWAFAQLQIDTLVLEADARNLPSIRVAEKSGFRRQPDRMDDQNSEDIRRLAVFELHRSDTRPTD